MHKINVLVLYGYGLNCDIETAYAFTLAGANAHRVHINTLINGEADLFDFQIAAFVGGFGWGDDHGAGVVEAVRLKTRIGGKLIRFIEQGGLAIGICNGFQVLINMGLLPGFDGDYTDRSVALTFNDCGNFRDEWVRLATSPDTPCVFTKGMTEQFDLPIRHGEGKFYAEKPVINRLIENKQVVLQYAQPNGTPAEGKFPYNPNGSLADIAGVCDSTGRVFGLMPHPEAYLFRSNHPEWTRTRERYARRKESPPETADGFRFFQNAVDYLK